MRTPTRRPRRTASNKTLRAWTPRAPGDASPGALVNVAQLQPLVEPQPSQT